MTAKVAQSAETLCKSLQCKHSTYFLVNVIKYLDTSVSLIDSCVGGKEEQNFFCKAANVFAKVFIYL